MMLNNVLEAKGRLIKRAALSHLVRVHLWTDGWTYARIYGQKIEGKEVKLAAIAILTHPLIILAPTAWALIRPESVTSIANQGMHGLSEVLYAFTSGAANNGSAFGGLSAGTNFMR